MNDFDVIVVGGGPAGSTVATLCAQRGVRVLLLEHKKFPRHKVCGDVINPNCWPVLERLGVADGVRALPHSRLTGALFSATHGATIEVPAREMIAVRRSLFDDCLLARARASGVTVLEGETAHEILPRWRVRTKDHEYQSKILVGADGRHSLVARKTGLVRTNHHSGNGHVAFQAHFRAPKSMDDRVQLHLFGGGYSGVVRVDDATVNLCIVTDETTAGAHRAVEDLFAATVWKNPQFGALGIAPEPLEPFQSAHPLCAPMNTPSSDGVFLVGDALRVLEPFTGQGIFFALRTAEIAAETICSGAVDSYAAAVAQLYRVHACTNELLRRLLYRERLGGVLIAALNHWPSGSRWLAHGVLAA